MGVTVRACSASSMTFRTRCLVSVYGFHLLFILGVSGTVLVMVTRSVKSTANPARTRIYVLARQLNVPSAELLASAKRLGASVRTSSSAVDADVEQALRDAHPSRPYAEDHLVSGPLAGVSPAVVAAHVPAPLDPAPVVVVDDVRGSVSSEKPKGKKGKT